MKEHCDTSLLAGLGYLIEEFIVYFTFAPSLIHKLYSLKQADPESPETWAQMSETLKRTLDMQEKLNAWYDRYSRIAPAPRETISPSEDKLYPMVLSYSDPTNASVFCGYYSYTVIIREILKACSYPGEHEAITICFRDQICKSVEHNGRGFLGPYQMAFPLRVAFEVADPVVKPWIKGWFIRLSNVYPALQPQRFGWFLPDRGALFMFKLCAEVLRYLTTPGPIWRLPCTHSKTLPSIHLIPMGLSHSHLQQTKLAQSPCVLWTKSWQ